jgi:hypothetical protein
MVLNIKHEEDAGPGIAKMLTEIVLQDIYDLKKFRVVGEKDINQMLNTEQRKQLAGCNDTSCLVEIAGTLIALVSDLALGRLFVARFGGAGFPGSVQRTQ